MAESPLPILDYAYLRQRAMASQALEVELLSLFIAEVERLMDQVEQARDELERRERLEAMVAAAGSVGAARLRQLARRMRADAAEEPDLDGLRGSVQEVVAYIRGFGL